MSTEHYLIAKVEDAGFNVRKAKMNMIIECITAKLVEVPYAVANEIISIALGDTGVLKALSKITQSNYNEEEVSNLIDEVMARRSQEPQQNNEGSIDVKAMAEEAIMECIMAHSFRKIKLWELINMIEYWSVVYENGDVELWIKFKDGPKLKIDKKLSKLKTYLAQQFLELDVGGSFDFDTLIVSLRVNAKDKYKRFSYVDSSEFANLLRKKIVNAIGIGNYDVFCSCESVPPKVYVKKSYFMEEIASDVADILRIPLKDVPIVFKEWGIFINDDTTEMKPPKCVAGPDYKGVTKSKYYEVDVEKLAEITQVEKDNICPQENKGEGEPGSNDSQSENRG
jgi:hypothetical protein